MGLGKYFNHTRKRGVGYGIMTPAPPRLNLESVILKNREQLVPRNILRVLADSIQSFLALAQQHHRSIMILYRDTTFDTKIL